MPAAFTPDDWELFETRVFVLFDSKIGHDGIIITYLLCNPALTPANTQAMTISCKDMVLCPWELGTNCQLPCHWDAEGLGKVEIIVHTNISLMQSLLFYSY